MAGGFQGERTIRQNLVAVLFGKPLKEDGEFLFGTGAEELDPVACEDLGIKVREPETQQSLGIVAFGGIFPDAWQFVEPAGHGFPANWIAAREGLQDQSPGSQEISLAVKKNTQVKGRRNLLRLIVVVGQALGEGSR